MSKNSDGCIQTIEDVDVVTSFVATIRASDIKSIFKEVNKLKSSIKHCTSYLNSGEWINIMGQSAISKIMSFCKVLVLVNVI